MDLALSITMKNALQVFLIFLPFEQGVGGYGPFEQGGGGYGPPGFATGVKI